MKKKVAKIFKKYGEVEIKKNYDPKTKKEKTTAIIGSRRSINQAIGNVLLKGTKEEQAEIGKLLTGNYYEDWDGKEIIKY